MSCGPWELSKWLTPDSSVMSIYYTYRAMRFHSEMFFLLHHLQLPKGKVDPL